MRNWLLSLLLFSLLSCEKDDDPHPVPVEQPKDELNGWQKIITKTNDYFTDIAFATPANGYLAGANGVYKTVDSGKTWLPEPSITAKPVTINFLNPQYGYAVGDNNMPLTNNGGASWLSKSVMPGKLVIDVCFVSPSNGYAALQSGPILKTNDTGNTWRPVGNFINRNCFSIFFLNEQQGWYATKDSLYHTTNGGSSWSSQKVTNSNIFTVFFTDPNHGWLTSDTSVYRTINGGTTWSKTSLDGNTFDIQFLNAQVGYVSVNNGVYKTTDGGTTWMKTLTAQLAPFPELLFLNENTGWVAGGQDIIYRWKK